MDPEATPSKFSLTNFQTLVAGIELLYNVGRKLSDATANQRCEYLGQEASMAFVKTMMSLEDLDSDYLFASSSSSLPN